mgnify:CR=1 FL=1
MQCWARFVWGSDGLWPGPIDFNDPRLLEHPLHIEFRRNTQSGLPLGRLRNFIDEYGPVQVDAAAKSHKEVVDLLMVGCERAAIDIFAPDKEISLGHAVSEQIMMTISLPSEVTLTYLTDTLNPRLNEVLNIGPESALLVSKRRGDLAFVMDRLPSRLRNSFSWWLAPDEGEMVPLRSDKYIAGWVLDGARLLGE